MVLPEGKVVGEWAKTMKGIKRCKLPVRKLISHRDVMHGTRNTVSHITVTLYSDGWLLDLSR